jgi:hypothetical protein
VVLGRLVGFDFDPGSGTFYVVDSIAGGNNRLFTLDVATGIVAPQANLTGSGFRFLRPGRAPCECRPDLWMKIRWRPICRRISGAEPNTVSPSLFISRDIWVRNNPDATTGTSANPGPDTTAAVDRFYANEHQHQNPIYVNASTANSVYVKIRNRGCTSSTGTEKLRVYWASASTGLPWPGTGVWNEIDAVAGGGIDPCPLPVIAPGQDYIAQLAWVPPNPAAFGGNQHFCLVARIETQPVSPFGMSFAEGPVLWQNVAHNNNIVWKKRHGDHGRQWRRQGDRRHPFTHPRDAGPAFRRACDGAEQPLPAARGHLRRSRPGVAGQVGARRNARGWLRAFEQLDSISASPLPPTPCWAGCPLRRTRRTPST